MASTSNIALSNALGWAGIEHPVFPLHGLATDGRCTCGKEDCSSACKHPYASFAPRGAHSATIDTTAISSWFERRPRLNYGVAAARLLVVDVDPRNGGDESWASIEAKISIPPTWRVRTGSGGAHIYFAAPALQPAVSAKPLLGIDIKAGAGAYVVGPGSVHATGNRYTWAPGHTPRDVPLQLPPAELLAELTEHRTCKARPVEFYREIAANGLENGSRNERLAKIAAHLYCHLFEPDDDLILDLMQGWNLGRGKPPLEAAEVENIVAGVALREFKKRGGVR